MSIPLNKSYISTSFGDRRLDKPVDMLILHYTATPTTKCAIDILCDPDQEVSSHYVVSEDGEIFQLVDEDKRAWHAGASSWEGESDINSRSIGIEIQNHGRTDEGYAEFEFEQMKAVILLCDDICRRHQISPHHVLGHSDVAPGRKIDPGPKFPWDELHQAGIGAYVPELASKTAEPIASLMDQGAHVRQLQQSLFDYGYGIEVTGQFNEQTLIVVQAFQSHFRPAQVDGKWDEICKQILTKLLTMRDDYHSSARVVAPNNTIV